ncbi:acyltransferase family protein [Clostridium sp. C105KSO13]|uniref:acyltransferase family protein n=1 Tax=Clostridium sp. C105KSO13 TaxID=1776045 RepID=UPI00114681AF|nr:acyltransferase family protein [Clostridium sp. C105KSO13]
MGDKELSLRTVLGSFIPSNWYIILYCALILVAPYTNYLINHISKKQFQILLGVITVIFSVWNTIFEMASDFLDIRLLGISTISINGSQAGYNIVNFVFLYLLGSYVGKYSISIKKRYLSVLYICALCVTVILSKYTDISWNYDNIFVTIMSVSFFALWGKGITLENKQRVNVIAKGTVGIYIIHTKELITNVLWGYFSIKQASQSTPIFFTFNMLGCILVTYIICYAIEATCRWCIKPISNYLDKCIVLNRNIIQLVTEEK